MEFTNQSIDEFVSAWREEFGEQLTPDEAKVEAKNLLELAWRLAQLLPDEGGYVEGRRNANQS